MSSGAELVHVTIDGQEVIVPLTKMAHDPLFKTNREIPTTIYDAALALAQQTGKPNPIPILCHREHINPVAVCRMCMVDVKERVLVPACYRPVKDKLVVETAATSEKVRTTVKILTQLLLADHPSPCEKQRQHGDCELEMIAQQYQVAATPFAPRAHAKVHDNSSLVIAVDHNACILCDRCVRACNDIRDNQVIGRMGKGYGAQIAFDLNNPMGDSSCVACGECMVSCPTGALVNRTTVKPTDSLPPGSKAVPPEELVRMPLFQEVSHAFLQFNEGSVWRRHVKKGEVLCREGDSGSTAFLIEKGKVQVSLKTPMKHVKSRKSKTDKVNWGIFGLMRRFTTGLVAGADDSKRSSRFIPVDAPVSLDSRHPVATLGEGDLFGEMACMSNYPRAATVEALEDCTVLEMRRNVLYILQRNKNSRAWLDKRYRERSIDSHLRSVPLFADLFTDGAEFDAFVDFLRPRVELKQVPPGEVILRQGDPADNMYLVRVGFVKVSQRRPGGEQVLTYLGPGSYFGEIGLLSHLPELQKLAPPGVRTATCTALDHVDLVQIPGGDFLAIVERFPQLKETIVRSAVQALKSNEDVQKEMAVPLGEFLQQGLMNAQSLLVLDLEKCTRCDECTKACADSHDGVTRLIREGLRFDKFLVASSCRSCLDPYCLVGCPVAAINRRDPGGNGGDKSREIIIEDWCIGCGKCAENCPYGNINMHGFEELREDLADHARKVAVIQQKATMCDLCTGLDSQPSCVYACPHDAAHRMTGIELLSVVREAAK